MPRCDRYLDATARHELTISLSPQVPRGPCCFERLRCVASAPCWATATCGNLDLPWQWRRGPVGGCNHGKVGVMMRPEHSLVHCSHPSPLKLLHHHYNEISSIGSCHGKLVGPLRMPASMQIRRRADIWPRAHSSTAIVLLVLAQVPVHMQHW